MDIQKAVTDLTDAGWSQSRIAREVGLGTTQPTINRIKSGVTKYPRFELGMAIIELHRRFVIDKASAA